LANFYAEYINQLGLQDKNGNVLVRKASNSGIYTAGSYYDYLVSVVEQSLNDFFTDTTFPYTETSGGNPGGGMPQGGMPPGGRSPQGGTPPDGTTPMGNMLSGNSSATQTATTYQTAQDCIASLN
jgi:hypothetical protein